MNPLNKTSNPEGDTRSLLKNQHRKAYSICRLFASSYKEHQGLFARIIAGAHQSIEANKTREAKQTLFLRACINTAVLHSLTKSLAATESGLAEPQEAIEFKSPDYQKSILQFREAVGEVSDYEKIQLFLYFEKLSSDGTGLTGMPTAGKKEQAESPKKTLIPYLKEKLIWT